jgi:hypothetical protein
MAWIKRNLYFVIGSAVAAALMGLAGWYLYSQWDRNNQILADLDKEYGELDNLNRQNPHPGNDKVDNIKIAREQRQQLLDYLKQTRPFFQRIPPIPDVPRLTDHEFSETLSRTIVQMQRAAAAANVGLASNYCFSFQAQNSQLNFAPGNLGPLSVQLGEVKAICDVLFQARINALDGVRREPISTNDLAGPLTDYLDQKSVTNDLAVVSPYEVTFRCFSAELASVLGGFASSPYGIIVKTINVEPAAAETLTGPQPAMYTPPPTPVVQQIIPPPIPRAAEDPFLSRYGRGGATRYTPPPPVYAPQPVAATASHGLPTVLDETLLKVTLMFDVVKLLPAK